MTFAVKKISDAVGEDAINEIARMTFDNGGSLSHAFMPSMIAADLQALARDRLRFGANDSAGGRVIMEYPNNFLQRY